MALTITNPNASAYDPVEVSTGVYHIKAYLPSGSVTITTTSDLTVPTGLLVTVPFGEQGLIEPYSAEESGYPVVNVMDPQTNGILDIVLRARYDDVATNYTIADQDIIAVLVDTNPAVYQNPDTTGIAGPRGPAGPTGATGPTAAVVRLFDDDSDAATATKTTTNNINLECGSGTVSLKDSTKTNLICNSTSTTVYSDAFQYTSGLATFADVACEDIDSTGNITVSGTLTASGALALTNLTVSADPTAVDHVTRKDYVDAKVAAVTVTLSSDTYLEKAGDTMSGDITMYDSVTNSVGDIVFPVVVTSATSSIGTVNDSGSVDGVVNTIKFDGTPDLSGITAGEDYLEIKNSSNVQVLYSLISSVDAAGYRVVVAASISNDAYNTMDAYHVDITNSFNGKITGLSSTVGDDDDVASQGYTDTISQGNVDTLEAEVRACIASCADFAEFKSRAPTWATS